MNDTTCQNSLVLKQCEYWFLTVLQATLQSGLRISTASCEIRKTDQDISKLNFILYTAGKFIQCCALIVTGKISKEFIGECWTYSVSALPRL